MAEKVVVRQKSNYETEFWALDPEAPESAGLFPVRHVEELTPYGMLLASIGSCTAVVVNTYARYHGLELHEVELASEYQRTFKEDCEHCEEISKYDEQINMDIRFRGNLTPQQHDKLFKISMQCPIHKMLKSGIRVESRLVQDEILKKTASPDLT